MRQNPGRGEVLEPEDFKQRREWGVAWKKNMKIFLDPATYGNYPAYNKYE